MPVNF